MTETMARPQPSDRYTATSGRVQLTGIQALARPWHGVRKASRVPAVTRLPGANRLNVAAGRL